MSLHIIEEGMGMRYHGVEGLQEEQKWQLLSVTQRGRSEVAAVHKIRRLSAFRKKTDFRTVDSLATLY